MNKNKIYLMVVSFFVIASIFTIFWITKNSNIRLFSSVSLSNVYNKEIHDSFESPIRWTPGQSVKKSVIVDNNESFRIAVRVSFDQKWVSATGKILSLKQNGNDTVIIKIDEDNWVKEGEYYYYKRGLNKNETTTSLIDSITLNRLLTNDSVCVREGNSITCTSSGAGYDGAIYTLNIKIEKVEYNAYKNYWNTNIDIL